MVSSLTVRCVTINAREPEALAGFWAGVIGGTPRDAGNDFVLLDPGQGRVPLLFQKSDSPIRDPAGFTWTSAPPTESPPSSWLRRWAAG